MKVYDLPDPDISRLWAFRGNDAVYEVCLVIDNVVECRLLGPNGMWTPVEAKDRGHWLPVTITMPIFPPEESPEVKAFKAAVKGLGKERWESLVDQWDDYRGDEDRKHKYLGEDFKDFFIDERYSI